MTKSSEPCVVRNLARYKRSARSNAIIRQFIFYHQSEHQNPIPFNLVLSTLQPIIDIEINKALHLHPLPPHLDRDDLIQECSTTLLRCLQKFDPTRPFFLTYFRSALHRSLRDVLNSHNRLARDSMNPAPDFLEPTYEDSTETSFSTEPSTLPSTAYTFSSLLSMFLDDPVQIALLTHLQTLPLPLAAIKLHLSTAKARSLAQSALKTLRQAVKGRSIPASRPSPVLENPVSSLETLSKNPSTQAQPGPNKLSSHPPETKLTRHPAQTLPPSLVELPGQSSPPLSLVGGMKSEARGKGAGGVVQSGPTGGGEGPKHTVHTRCNAGGDTTAQHASSPGQYGVPTRTGETK